jgi:hypothetical protein
MPGGSRPPSMVKVLRALPYSDRLMACISSPGLSSGSSGIVKLAARGSTVRMKAPWSLKPAASATCSTTGK